MKISIVTPLYKGKKYIQRIISMVERNIIVCNYVLPCSCEIIFVNDYPGDSISEQDINYSSVIDVVTVIQNKHNMGIHRSRVAGLEHSKGDYVLFLDQDDQISDAYILCQLKEIKNNDAVLCNGEFRNHKLIYRDAQHQKEAVDKIGYLKQKTVIVSPGQVVIKRRSIPIEWTQVILEENGSDDVLLWIMMLEKNCSFAINPLVLYKHNEEGANASLNFVNMKKSVTELCCVLREKKVLCGENLKLCVDALQGRIHKYNLYIEILDNWHNILSNIEYECKSNCYKTIAIYGRGVIGEKLYTDLNNIGIDISFFIDKDASLYMDSDEVFQLDRVNQVVDLVIITSIFDIGNIRKNFASKGNVLNIKGLADYKNN